jgi:N-dimethylarginine dimethylaminohydrolase
VKGNVATKRPNVSYHNILIGISIGHIPTRTTNFDETLKYASVEIITIHMECLRKTVGTTTKYQASTTNVTHA